MIYRADREEVKKYINKQLVGATLLWNHIYSADWANRQVSLYVNSKDQLMILQHSGSINDVTGNFFDRARLTYYTMLQSGERREVYNDRNDISKHLATTTLYVGDSPTMIVQHNDGIKSAINKFDENKKLYMYGIVHREDGPSDMGTIFGEYTYMLNNKNVSRENFLLNVYNNDIHDDETRGLAMASIFLEEESKIVDLDYIMSNKEYK